MNDLGNRLAAIRQLLDNSTVIDHALVQRVFHSLDGLNISGLAPNIWARLEPILVDYSSIIDQYRDPEQPDWQPTASALIAYACCINDLLILADDLPASSGTRTTGS
jgi:hypothetical protein